MGIDRKAMLGVALALVGSGAQAATYYVPDNYGTIQAALTAASTGDTIIVRDGTYTGASNRDLDFGGKEMILQSQNGAAACIIDCQNSGRGFYFHSYENTTAVVDGFTIRNGSATHGAGLYCYAASPTIRNNVITGNSATDYGGGICGYQCGSSVTSNTIKDNTADRGAGLYCYFGYPTFDGNTFSGNSATRGGGIYGERCHGPITGNTIADNTASENGGGIYWWGTQLGGIEGNIICGNSARGGAGIYIMSYSPAIENNTITWNTATWSGGGMDCGSIDNTLYIRENTIAGNHAGWDGGGVYSSLVIVRLRNNVICGNRTWDEGGGIYYGSASSGGEVRGNTISENYGGGIRAGSGAPSIRNCIVWGNGDDLNGCSATYSDIEDGDAGTGNISDDPAFAGGPSGSWTANATYNSSTFQSTLTDGTASWTTNQFAGMLINPDTSEERQSVIVGNTATTITVWADVSSVGHAGDGYQIWDYHLKSFYGRWTKDGWVKDARAEHSPCIDKGSPSDSYYYEPLPHGYCVNMGAYGNTDQASGGIGPTAVVLFDVAARSTQRGVLVQWRTGCEPGLAGFRVLRRDGGGAFRPMGEALVACRGDGVTGARYRFLDFLRVPVGSHVSYKVEAIDLSGRASESSGPIAPP